MTVLRTRISRYFQRDKRLSGPPGENTERKKSQTSLLTLGEDVIVHHLLSYLAVGDLMALFHTCMNLRDMVAKHAKWSQIRATAFPFDSVGLQGSEFEQHFRRSRARAYAFWVVQGQLPKMYMLVPGVEIAKLASSGFCTAIMSTSGHLYCAAEGTPAVSQSNNDSLILRPQQPDRLVLNQLNSDMQVCDIWGTQGYLYSRTKCNRLFVRWTIAMKPLEISFPGLESLLPHFKNVVSCASDHWHVSLMHKGKGLVWWQSDYSGKARDGVTKWTVIGKHLQLCDLTVVGERIVVLTRSGQILSLSPPTEPCSRLAKIQHCLGPKQLERALKENVKITAIHRASDHSVMLSGSSGHIAEYDYRTLQLQVQQGSDSKFLVADIDVSDANSPWILSKSGMVHNTCEYNWIQALSFNILNNPRDRHIQRLDGGPGKELNHAERWDIQENTSTQNKALINLDVIEAQSQPVFLPQVVQMSHQRVSAQASIHTFLVAEDFDDLQYTYKGSAPYRSTTVFMESMTGSDSSSCESASDSETSEDEREDKEASVDQFSDAPSEIAPPSRQKYDAEARMPLFVPRNSSLRPHIRLPFPSFIQRGITANKSYFP